MTGRDEEPRRVAVLGAGAIGTAIARALTAAAFEVVVWNRSPGRTAAAADAGAQVAPSAADAAESAQLVLVTVTDYPAVLAVLDGLRHSASAGTLAVLTTGTPEDACDAAKRAEALGFAYLDGGVQTAPEDIGTPTATILLGGDEQAFRDHQTVFERLCTPRYVGSSPEAAAIWDIALFGIWYDAQLGLLRALGVAADHGIDLVAFSETAATQLGHASASATGTAAEAVEHRYPHGPADLHEHLPVLEQLLAQRRNARLGDGGLGPVVSLTKAAIEAGHGADGLTRLLAIADERRVDAHRGRSESA